jgi:P27 family predicted phage terminase small subunit
MPARKSAGRKSASGTLRHHRDPKSEQAPRLEEPPHPPAHLSDGAKREWRALAPAAWTIGTLTVADLVAFALLAETLATAEAARQTVAAEGFSVSTGDSGQKAHPAVGAMAAARGQARQLLDAFGLMPRSRQGLDVPPLAVPGMAPQPSGTRAMRDSAETDIAATVRLLRARGSASNAA